MNKTEMFAAITAQRLRLCDTLDSLTDAEWGAASLCVGWRVRDVVGHLVGILEPTRLQAFVGIAKARNFHRYTNRLAIANGARDPKELAATYRHLAGKNFTPPGLGPIAPLSDICIHTRDIERPLGRPSTLVRTDLEAVTAFICGGRAPFFVPFSRTKGLRLVATDLGWSRGQGDEISGPAEALVMAVAGRRHALNDVTGPGIQKLAARLG